MKILLSLAMTAASCAGELGGEQSEEPGGVFAGLPSCSDCGPSISHSDCSPPFHDSCDESLPGIRMLRGRAYNRSDFVAAFVDLCSDGVRVTATEPTNRLTTTSKWARSVGADLAVNGDFFASGPRVYGNAVGGGIRWPTEQTGTDPNIAYEWYYEKHGWIGFAKDRVYFSHTEYTKTRRDVSDGWMPSTVTNLVPSSVESLVSGFPELVIEGKVHECPETGRCFPDRGDMSDRHPRTAMGLSADHSTFILVVADGRRSGQSGLLGIELAQLMADLGAWEAFNLDGGGSSEMFFDGSSILDPGDHRAVANHWGVFAGADGVAPQNCHGYCPPAAATCEDAWDQTVCEGEPGMRTCLGDGVQRCTCGANGQWIECAGGCIR